MRMGVACMSRCQSERREQTEYCEQEIDEIGTSFAIRDAEEISFAVKIVHELVDRARHKRLVVRVSLCEDSKQRGNRFLRRTNNENLEEQWGHPASGRIRHQRRDAASGKGEWCLRCRFVGHEASMWSERIRLRRYRLDVRGEAQR